ncbi:MAG: exo-alpha-sialidase [Candidatus Omnitrophota bacterium]|jgi:predicted neuraminidase
MTIKRRVISTLAGLFLASVIFFTIPINVAAEPVNAYHKLPHKELVFEPGQVISSHAPAIVELPGGELFVAWYAPPERGSPKTVIWAARKPVGADKWTKPLIINETPGHSDKNPVLFLGPDKKLWLFWVAETRWWKIVDNKVYARVSMDFGHTWGEIHDLKAFSGFLVRANPITLKDGQTILPLYTDLSTSSAVSISRDGGLTWSKPIYMLFLFGIQPTIIQRSDLSLFALTRTGMWPRLSWQAISYNFGRSWKKQWVSNVKNPGCSLVMIKLKSGNVALVFNDSKLSREGISIALSHDEGRTWPYVRMIEFKSGSINVYPSIIQDGVGLIHVVYSYDCRQSIAHFVTDEKWIEGRPL